METRTETRNKKKLILVIFCIFLAIALSITGIIAFFSDSVTTSDSSVNTGNLDIVQNGSVVVTKNGTGTSSTIDNFHPGDVAVIKIPVKNEGSHSAWLRANITLTGSAVVASGAGTGFNNMFEVYRGQYTQDSVTTAPGVHKLTMAYSAATGSAWSEAAQAYYGVINGDSSKGSGKYDTETAGTNGVVATNIFLNSGTNGNEGDLYYTIYYKPQADNSFQLKGFSFKYKLQALQLRNNTSPNWVGVG